MKAKIKQQWLKELRSGEWVQGCGQLMNDKDEACCLGVLCDIAVREGVIKPWRKNDYTSNSWEVSESIGILPQKIAKWAGLTSSNPIIQGYGLSFYNDIKAFDFSAIADLIEKYL